MNPSLNSLPLFLALNATESKIIVSAAHVKRFWRDQAIFSQYDLVGQIFMLLSGSVKLTHPVTNGNEVILRLVSRGDLVGRVFDRGGGQCCAASAVESSALLTWDVGVFECLLAKFPAFRRNIIHAVEETLMEMEQRFWGASTQSIESRLSSELLRLANRLAERQNTREPRISLSHAELAQLTGTSASTVSRLLREWQSQRIVAIQRCAVVVRNSNALAKISERD
jgi:CRP-like cAMP-binding protein